MTLADFRIVMAGVLAVAFVAQAAAIVIGVFFLSRLVRKARAYLDLVGRNAVLSNEQMTASAEGIKAEVRRVPTDAAKVVLETLAATGVPVAPAPPDRGTLTGLLAGVLGGATASALACGPTGGTVVVPDRGAAVSTVTHDTDHAAAGLAALKADDLAAAERHFVRCQDDARLAEVRVRQGRYDEAVALTEHKADPLSRLVLALACRGRGEGHRYARHLREAAALGSEPAALLLSRGDPA